MRPVLSPESVTRASGILGSGPLPAPEGSLVVLARLLDALATMRECSPSGIPLDVVGWYLCPDEVASTREMLGLPRPAPHNSWRRGGDLESASEAVDHAWMIEAGGLRTGDHVLLLPAHAQREYVPPFRGTVDALTWRDWPATWNRPDGPRRFRHRLDRDPFEVFIVSGGAAGGSELDPQPPWRVLLDTSRQRGGEARASVIAARSACTLLLGARQLGAHRGYRDRMHDWLSLRARYYPPRFCGILETLASTGASLDEITQAGIRLQAELQGLR